MNFRFGCAKSLYARHMHPRVRLGPDDLPVLRRRVRSGGSKLILAALRRKVAPLVPPVLDATDLPGMLSEWNASWDRPGTKVIWGLFDLAFVGVLDENADAMEAGRRVLAALPPADDRLGRGTKTICYGLGPVGALAYDLLHTTMTEAARRAFCDWILDMGIRFSLKRLSGNYFCCAGQNIPMGGLHSGLMSLLAIEGDAGVPDLQAERAQFLLMLEASLNTALGP